MDDVRITCGIPTKNRYDLLSHTLLSLAFQTRTPYEIIIVDDSDKIIDLRTLPTFQYIFILFDDLGIKWRVEFGKKLGPHHSHQIVKEKSETELIFRIDDDCIAKSDTLNILFNQIRNNVGAIAPLVITPPHKDAPENAENKITNIFAPNIQWFVHDKVKNIEVDHLYSCFLYKKSISNYELNLSNKAHREETIFSHSIKQAGYKLLVNTGAIVYHFRSQSGGIRSDNGVAGYEQDEKIFNSYLNLWNINSELQTKFVILENGIGDHYAFKNILPDLKKNHSKITMAVCYPEIFENEDVTLISIAEAKQIFNDISAYNIYFKMSQWNWNKSLTEAFRKLYL